MLDTETIAAQDRWEKAFNALFQQTMEVPPPDLIERVRAMPDRPGDNAPTRRDAAIAHLFTALVNKRFYSMATDLEAETRLRARIDRLTATGQPLAVATDQDALFCLAVLDTHTGGDPARAAANFAKLRAMLPPGHHLIASCEDGLNAARTLIGRQNQTVAVDAPQSPARRLLVRLGLAQPPQKTVRDIRLSDFSIVPDDAKLPWLDRAATPEAGLTPEQLSWRRDGVVALRGFLPADLVDAYVARRAQLENPAGWRSGSPYQHVPEMRALALYPPLMTMQKSLLGEDMLLHLALTGWISTERDWHQDDYLNPPDVHTWYTAVWMALDTIGPDVGPFEYIPGSHRWPLMTGEKVRALLTDEERARREGPGQINHWATYSERFVTPAIETEIRERGVPPVQFLAEKGDVLIWHSRLMHRGTAPRRRDLERRSLITHYSGVNHRPDMPGRATDENGQHYALFETPLH